MSAKDILRTTRPFIFAKRWLLVGGVGLLCPLVQGCSTDQGLALDSISVNISGNAAPWRHRNQNLPPPGTLFPYGSLVACPQVPVGNGLARCQ